MHHRYELHKKVRIWAKFREKSHISKSNFYDTIWNTAVISNNKFAREMLLFAFQFQLLYCVKILNSIQFLKLCSLGIQRYKYVGNLIYLFVENFQCLSQEFWEKRGILANFLIFCVIHNGGALRFRHGTFSEQFPFHENG